MRTMFKTGKAIDGWLVREHYGMMYAGLYVVLAAFLLMGAGFGFAVSGVYSLNDGEEIDAGFLWLFMALLSMFGYVGIFLLEYRLWKKAGSPMEDPVDCRKVDFSLVDAAVNEYIAEHPNR